MPQDPRKGESLSAFTTWSDQRVEQLRVPPQSQEAEQAVLGGLMLVPNSYDRVADIVSADDFYRQDHRLIYRAIGELAQKSKPYDAVTLGEWFEARGMSEQVSGGAYLIELASSTPSAANIVAYARIVKDKATLRNLIDIGTDIVNNAYITEGRDVGEIMALAETSVTRASATVSSTVQTGRDGLKRTYRELERRLTCDDKLLGVTTSVDALDHMTQGLQDTDLIILAARPSMGKTAFMRQMSRAAAIQGRKPYICEMEMSATQLYMRDIAAVSGVDLAKVRNPKLASPFEMDRIRNAIAKMSEWEWFLDESVAPTAEEVASRIRRMKAQHDIGIAFVDYLQIMNLGDVKFGITSAVQNITSTLKATAKSLNIPIVLLSQLNRSLESRPDKRPIMSDLRDSGAIEQDADMVLFLYRQGYYEKDWAKDDPRQEQAEIIIGKQRNGETGSVPVQWLGRYQQFNNLHYGALRPNYNPDPRAEAKRGFEPTQRTGLTYGKGRRED